MVKKTEKKPEYWALLSANNVSTDVSLEIYPSKEKAQHAMELSVECLREDFGDSADVEQEDESASVYNRSSNDMYYWNIEQITAGHMRE